MGILNPKSARPIFLIGGLDDIARGDRRAAEHAHHVLPHHARPRRQHGPVRKPVRLLRRNASIYFVLMSRVLPGYTDV